MKKIILLLVLCSSTLMAQQFKKELVGKYLPAKVKFGDGKVVEVLMRYQPPQFFKNPKNKFSISMTKSEADAYDHTGGIEAFMIDNVIWALRPSPVAEPANSLNYVVLNRQGAIEEYQFMTSTLKSESDFNEAFNPSGTITRKLNTKGKMASEMSETQLREWVSDSPEIMIELKQADSLAAAAKSQTEDSQGANNKEAKPKGLLGKLESMQKKEADMKSGNTNMALIVNNYNVWYEEKNPGKITYHFVDPPVRKKSALEDFNEKQKVEKEKAEAKKKKDDLLANRGTTPSPEIASKKPNVPPKKETFSAKIKRYEADGHKIAVVMQEQKTKVRATIRGTNTNPKDVGFNEKPEADFIEEGVFESTVSELNKVYNTTIFEAVSLSQIPLIKVKSGQADNWWSTCYKTVVYLSHLREYSCSNDILSDGTGYEATGSIGLYANVFEYVDDGKQGTDILKRLYSLGYGNSDPFKYTSKDWPITFEFLEAKIDWSKVNQRYDKKRQEQFAKLVEKWD